MSAELCEICQECVFTVYHKCNPEYECWMEEDDGCFWKDKPFVCRGVDHEEAANRFLQDYNEQGEYETVGEEVIIVVRGIDNWADSTDKVTKRPRSLAEPTIEYSSTEIEENADAETEETA